MSAELLLHIHAQPAQHEEAYIVGNRAGLLALRDAISQALLTGEATTSNSPDGHQLMTADGEGYTVTITCDNSAWNSPTWQAVLLPYTRDRAQDRREHVVRPWDRLRPRHQRSPTRTPISPLLVRAARLLAILRLSLSGATHAHES